MSQKAEKRWECFATLRKEMNELADEIIEWSADGHYRDRLIQLYDLADTVFGAKNVKRLLMALEGLESQLQSGFTPEARAQEERAEKAEQDSKELEESLGVANAATQVWKERAKAAEQRLQQPVATQPGMAIITEAIGAHGYIVGCLQRNRPDLALEEALKWVAVFSQAASKVDSDTNEKPSVTDEIDRFVDQVCGDKPADHQQ